MMRIAAVLILTALLAACSGSDRVEGIVRGLAPQPEARKPIQNPAEE
jgi:major membrane immunogen (membrane-anchored lipoprotein)